MIAPGALIANASQKFNLSRGLIQPMPPAGDVCGFESLRSVNRYK